MMNKKIYSFLSVFFLVLMLPPLVVGGAYLSFFLDISIFLPIILSGFGVFFGVIGVKNPLRIYIIAANLFVLVFYSLVSLIGIYGFQQP